MTRALEPVPDRVTEHEPDYEADLPWLHAQVLGLGRPRYHCSDDGTWKAGAQVPTGRPGVLAEVGGTFGHPTLSAAIRNLLERCR